MTKLTHVMAIGYQSWGRGVDPVDAIQQWKKHVGSIRGEIKIELRAVSANAYVDELGTLRSDGIETLPPVKMSRENFDLIWNGIEVLNELCYPADDALDALVSNGKFKSSEG